MTVTFIRVRRETRACEGEYRLINYSDGRGSHDAGNSYH